MDPAIRLGGNGEPPLSVEEAEIRVMRGLRTMDTPGVVKRTDLGVRSCWPRTLLEWADKLARLENRDESELAALRAPWSPTLRDLGDWIAAVGWLAHLPRYELELFRLLASNPPHTWRQIADILGERSVTSVKKRYAVILASVYARASGGSSEEKKPPRKTD
jgi:hypothetical protein